MRQNLPNKTSDEVLSMLLGLVIVGAVVMLVVNILGRFKGKVDVPGISDQKQLTLVGDEKINTPTSASVTGKKIAVKPIKTPVPTKAIAPTKVVAGGNYTVKRGDSLWKIATIQYGDGHQWNKIAKANSLKNPGVLFSGQKLILPEQTVAQSPTKTTTTKAVIAQNTNTNVKPGETYVVKKGDSLWKISVAVYADGYQWTKLWNNNRRIISNPSKIYSGTKLVLPVIKS